VTSDPREGTVDLPERPLHTRPGLVLLVGVGGAAGTAVRATVAALVPADGWPWATWAVNVTGAFLLGLLLDVLARTGPDDGRRRAARLLLGTGFLGGYTTFSTASTETVRLLEARRYAAAAATSVAMLVLSVGACAAGLALARTA